MAIAQLERLKEKTGGFGAFLFMGADFADWAATKRSYELFAEEVMPHFTGQLAAGAGQLRHGAGGRQPVGRRHARSATHDSRRLRGGASGPRLERVSAGDLVAVAIVVTIAAMVQITAGFGFSLSAVPLLRCSPSTPKPPACSPRVLSLVTSGLQARQGRARHPVAARRRIFWRCAARDAVRTAALRPGQ